MVSQMKGGGGILFSAKLLQHQDQAASYINYKLLYYGIINIPLPVPCIVSQCNIILVETKNITQNLQIYEYSGYVYVQFIYKHDTYNNVRKGEPCHLLFSSSLSDIIQVYSSIRARRQQRCHKSTGRITTNTGLTLGTQYKKDYGNPRGCLLKLARLWQLGFITTAGDHLQAVRRAE